MVSMLTLLNYWNRTRRLQLGGQILKNLIESAASFVDRTRRIVTQSAIRHQAMKSFESVRRSKNHERRGFTWIGTMSCC